jgi:hypothetical protein
MKTIVIKILSAISALALVSCGGENTNYDSAPQPRFLAQTISTNDSVSISLIGNRADYTITKSAQGYLFTDKAGATSAVAPLSLKRVDFADMSLALDTEGTAGQIFRLYQAAFNRPPDLAGVGFWLAANEAGVTLEQIADAFIRSAEFQSLYGANSTTEDFIIKIYLNALHRPAEPSGHAFWTKAIEGGTTRAAVLVFFSESIENKTATTPSIQGGIAYARSGVAYHPVARAGANQTVNVGTLVVLNGNGSSDTNGDPIKFSWTLIKPSGSFSSLSSATAERPTFTPDVPGTYTLSLAVSDGKLTGIVQSSATVIAVAPTPIIVADTGTYKCTSISHAFALTLYAQGHTYLDRDHDGKPCEATDIATETVATVPVVVVPLIGKQCYVNGYYRSNGTHVSGYWRRC